MGFDLGVTREGFAVQDRQWLRDVSGFDTTLGATLDASTFSSTRFPDGAVPSGTLLAQKDDRLWGPYDPAASDGRQKAVSGRLLFLLDAETVRAGRRLTVAGLDAGGVLRDYLPTPPTGVTGAAAAIGVVDTAAAAALPRVRFTNGKAA